jgi:hypothetical protein
MRLAWLGVFARYLLNPERELRLNSFPDLAPFAKLSSGATPPIEILIVMANSPE